MVKTGVTEDRVYCFVCEHPGLCTYEISKKLGMSGGRVRYTLNRLEQKKLIKFKFDRKNPRIKKLTYPVSAWGLLPRTFRKELGKFVRKARGV